MLTSQPKRTGQFNNKIIGAYPQIGQKSPGGHLGQHELFAGPAMPGHAVASTCTLVRSASCWSR